MTEIIMPKDYGEIANEGARRQYLRSQNMLVNRQMAAEDIKTNRLAGQQAIRLKNVDQSTGKLNQQGYHRDLELGGYGAEADAAVEDQHDKAIKHLERNIKFVDFVRAGLGEAIANPAAYPKILANAKEINQQINGPEAVLSIPDTYDYPSIKAAYEASISAKDKGMMHLEEAKNNYVRQKDQQAQQNWQATYDANQNNQQLNRDVQQQVKPEWVETPDASGKPMLTQKKEGVQVYKAPVNGAQSKQTPQQKADDAVEMKALIEQAKPLLMDSTSSGFGAKVDAFNRQFGVNDRKARNLNALKVVMANMVQKVPIPPGPQSDADLKQRIEAMGRIADPELAQDEKISAFNEVIKINDRLYKRAQEQGLIPTDSVNTQRPNALYDEQDMNDPDFAEYMRIHGGQ